MNIRFSIPQFAGGCCAGKKKDGQGGLAAAASTSVTLVEKEIQKDSEKESCHGGNCHAKRTPPEACHGGKCHGGACGAKTDASGSTASVDIVDKVGTAPALPAEPISTPQSATRFFLIRWGQAVTHWFRDFFSGLWQDLKLIFGADKNE